jgi:putative tricarboxylic transport membrane protein
MEKGNSPHLDTGRIAEFALAVGVVILGVVILWQTRGIRIPPMNAQMGPRTIPYVVGAGLVVVGLWFAVDVLRGRASQAGSGEDSEDADTTLPTEWDTIGFIAISLVVYLFLIERAGFIIASSVLFFGAAFGMGSRRILRDVVVAIVMSTAIYLIFTRGLDLPLPEGVLPLESIMAPR